MSKDNLSRKEKARTHIIKAQGLLPYMSYKEGDFPYYEGEYKTHIGQAKKELKGIYPTNDIIFQELDMKTNLGLMAALGGLDLGDQPFIDYKRDRVRKDAETFEAETKNQLTEVELVVLISEDLFHTLPHQFAPIRLVFRNNIARKTMKLLGEQFAHDSPMLVGVPNVIEPYLIENNEVWRV